jgi:hypothetical protein
MPNLTFEDISDAPGLARLAKDVRRLLAKRYGGPPPGRASLHDILRARLDLLLTGEPDEVQREARRRLWEAFGSPLKQNED